MPNTHVDIDNTEDCGSTDGDGDLKMIGDNCYVFAIRVCAGMMYYYAEKHGLISDATSIDDKINAFPTEENRRK